MNKVIVIGGGAAGLTAALSAAEAGSSVTLLEGNEKLGKKIYITGKGRCNVTNACDPAAFLNKVVKNPRFLFSALNAFGPEDMMALLERLGCPVKVERGDRVFPVSEKASDVTRALEKELRRLGVSIRLNTKVSHIFVENEAVCGAELEDGTRLDANRVIVATGGQSYPSTGSTGDGFRWMAELGHTVYPPLPSLIALTCGAAWVSALQGLSLKNVRLTLKRGKKVLYSDVGEMLFTHFGISGPLVLEMSCHLPEQLSDARVTLDLKPGLTPEQLDARLQRDFTAQPRKQLQNVLPGLLPLRLSALFPALAGVPADRVCGQITRAEREKLCQTLKALPMTLSARRPLAEAIVTRGGVTVREVQPATMESKLCPGLYFAGEVLDVDAHTGGFNLQIAFSTGALAGVSAAEKVLSQE